MTALRERGSVTLLVVTVALMLALSALAVADAAAMLVARARAQSAADAAALSAIVHQVPALGREGDPAVAARADAERNGAELVECRCTVGSATASVVVSVRPRFALLEWGGRRVRATATAEADPSLFESR